jgi:DNA-binding FrmR family transcriptional regulator
MAVAVKKKLDAVDRLRAIEGQIRGLQRMIEGDRYCIDILVQISAVHEALRGVGKIIMRNYLESCATNSIRSKDEKQRQSTYDELMDVIYKFAR